MGTEGQTLPDGALDLLPIIDTIATKLKVEVGNSAGCLFNLRNSLDLFGKEKRLEYRQ
jgi:hypothetical protein